MNPPVACAGAHTASSVKYMLTVHMHDFSLLHKICEIEAFLLICFHKRLRLQETLLRPPLDISHSLISSCFFLPFLHRIFNQLSPLFSSPLPPPLLFSLQAGEVDREGKSLLYFVGSSCRSVDVWERDRRLSSRARAHTLIKGKLRRRTLEFWDQSGRGVCVCVRSSVIHSPPPPPPLRSPPPPLPSATIPP